MRHEVYGVWIDSGDDTPWSELNIALPYYFG